jgi:hypothetical protein
MSTTRVLAHASPSTSLAEPRGLAARKIIGPLALALV